MAAGITNNTEGSIVGCNPQVLKGIMANSSLEDKSPSASPQSKQSFIEENKLSYLDRSYELSEQKVKELNDLFTEVDRKPASKLTNLNYHLAQIALQTHFVNADVNSFVAMAESDIHVLPKKKQALVRKRIAEVKESAANMNAGVNMYDRIVNTIKAMSDNNMKPTVQAAMKYTKFNAAVSNFIADMNKLTKNEGSDVVMDRFKVEQQLRQLMKDYSVDQEAGILYTVDTAKQSKENEAIAIKKAEDLGLDPAKVVKQKGNTWLVTLDTSPLDKMLELLPEYSDKNNKEKAERLFGIFNGNDYKESIRMAVQEGVLDKFYNDSDFFEKMDPGTQMKLALLLRKNHASNIGDVITQEQVDRLEALEKAGDRIIEVIKSDERKIKISDPDLITVPYSFLASYNHGDWKKWMPRIHRDWVEGGERQGKENPNLVIRWSHVKTYLERIKSAFLLDTIKELTEKKVDIEATKAEFFNELISQKLENKFPSVSMNGSQYNIFSSGFKIPETQVENTSSAVTRKAAGILTNIETLIQKLTQNLRSLYDIISSALASIGR